MEKNLDKALQSKWFAIAILFFLPFVIYFESLGFGLLSLDDPAYFLDGSLKGGRLEGLKSIWSSTILSDYSPVTQLTIWLDLALFGDKAWWGARLQSLFWFGMGTLAIRALLLQLSLRRGVVFSICLLYAVHPVCTQGVLWLAERKHLVSLALCLWSLERYVAARQSQDHALFLRHYITAWLLGAIALFAKPHAVALPVMVLAFEAIIQTGAWKKRLLAALPFVLSAAAFTWWNLSQVRSDLARDLLGGSRFAAALNDGPILWRYLAHVFMPANLAAYYCVPEYGAGSALCWASWGALLLVAGATVWFSRQRRIVLFGWVFGLAALSPALNIVPQLAPMTDHYLQWALPGWLTAIVLLFFDALERLPSVELRTKLGIGLATVSALFFVALSWVRIPEFSSTQNLFAAAVLKQGDSGLNWSRYAFTLNQSSNPEDRKLLGAAGLRALECADARRILPEPRMICTVQAAILLHQSGKDERMKTLVAEQSAILEKDAPVIIARMTRGWSSLRTGDNTSAVRALSDEFTPELAQAAGRLRAECRTGKRFPNAMPPVTGFYAKNAAADVELSTTAQMKLSALSVLAEAQLASGALEKAFDIASVIVNLDPRFDAGGEILARSYRSLGLPEAAEQFLKSRKSPPVSP